MILLHWTLFVLSICIIGAGLFRLITSPAEEAASALLTIMGGACLTLWTVQLSTSDRITALEKRIRQSE